MTNQPITFADHIISVRAEIIELSQQVDDLKKQNEAAMQVLEAIGQAVGALYQMQIQEQAEEAKAQESNDEIYDY